MLNELNSPASGDGVDDAEEIGDDLLADGLAAVTAPEDCGPTRRAVDHASRQGGGE
jgi:hypothetical protein